MTPSRPGHRSAYTLLEMIVVMSVSVTVLTLSATYLHRIMTVSSQAAKFLKAEQTGLRLSRQFRQDVLLATSVEVTERAGDEGVIVLLLHQPQSTGGDLEYRFASAHATRTMQLDSGAVSREQYRFPDGTRWKLQQAESRTRLLLSASNAPPELPEPQGDLTAAWRVPFELTVEATVGRLMRSAGGVFDASETEDGE